MKRAIIAVALLALCLPTAFAQEDDLGPQFVPNHIKYRDSKPNARGAGELATVETLALLSRNGTAQLEVTTGNLDTGEPSATANITKVQLKLNDVTTNFNNVDSGSWFTLPLGAVERHTPFQAHVNVMGLNGGNTEVVVVDDKVRRRPDLRIVAVDAPGAIRVGQPFSIVATIRELNGDTGARTSCYLETQNGVQLDRTDGIWVDAGDQVQCVFSQTLGTLGKHTYFVKIGATRPADWDPRFELQGLTVLATTDKQWELTAAQRTVEQTYIETLSSNSNFYTSGGSTETFDSMQFNAVIDEPIDLSTIRMSIAERTDGQLIYEYPVVGGFPPNTTNAPCRLSDRKHSVYLLCRFGDGLALNAITIGSSAVYLTQLWMAQFDPETQQNVYIPVFTMRQTSKFGAPQRYGSTYSLHITLTDAANHSWEVSPFINLVPYDTSVESGTRYRGEEPHVYRVDETYHEYGKTGSASLD
ncbi:MAG TPA: hypothetical protein VEK79_17010 [Thermoanaerobaculia bacterium]|nr:hypothetical protein [Thermoanaerobaculia bacterium]